MAEPICKRCIHHDICDAYTGEDTITFFPYNEDCKHFKSTTDVSEIRRGVWMIERHHTVSLNPYMDDNYQASAICSECGFCVDKGCKSFGYPELNVTNYCPNCGAKMDGKDEK